MKRTISIIYRICYIFFSLWAFGLLFYPFSGIDPSSYLSFAPAVNLLGLICVIPLLVKTIKKRPEKALLRFKALCAFLSFILVVCNLDVLFSPGANGWIMCILLPVMMFLDWLLFDKKGYLSTGDIFIWLGVLALLGLILFTVLKNILGLSNVFDLWGLFKDNADLLSLAIKALIGAALMNVIDTLLSGKSNKGLVSKIAFLWRIFFLIAEGWALFTISQKNLTVFVKSLADFTILANFLCFLCIAAVLVYNLIKYGSIFRQTSPFPRVKGIFTFCIVVAFLLFHFVSKGNLGNGPSLVLHLIGPIMMLFDWILFDSKGEFRLYEPFVWLILPIGFELIIQVLNGFVAFDAMFSLKYLAIMLVTGFVLLITDLILRRR